MLRPESVSETGLSFDTSLIPPLPLEKSRPIRTGSMQRASSVLGLLTPPLIRLCQGHQRRPEIHRQQLPLRRGLYFSVSAFRISAFGFDCKPRFRLLRLHQFAIMLENDLRRVPRLQSDFRHILNLTLTCSWRRNEMVGAVRFESITGFSVLFGRSGV